MFYLAVAIVLVAGGYLGWKLTSRSGYESAEYTLVQSDRPFEIRDYPDLLMATTTMQFKSQGDDGSFMRLFRYISGANDDKKKIAMTTPVFMESDARDSEGQMGFVVPKEVAEQRVPKPSQGEVQIRKRRGGRFAVMRFAGRMNPESLSDAEVKLRAWIDDQQLIGDDKAEFAGYDPPWTPGPLRRNEVLIRLK